MEMLVIKIVWLAVKLFVNVTPHLVTREIFTDAIYPVILTDVVFPANKLEGGYYSAVQYVKELL